MSLKKKQPKLRPLCNFTRLFHLLFFLSLSLLSRIHEFCFFTKFLTLTLELFILQASYLYGVLLGRGTT